MLSRTRQVKKMAFNKKIPCIWDRAGVQKLYNLELNVGKYSGLIH